MRLIALSDTLRRTPLAEGSAPHRDLYLITQQSKETDIHVSAGLEPGIPASERP